MGLVRSFQDDDCHQVIRCNDNDSSWKRNLKFRLRKRRHHNRGSSSAVVWIGVVWGTITALSLVRRPHSHRCNHHHSLVSAFALPAAPRSVVSMVTPTIHQLQLQLQNGEAEESFRPKKKENYKRRPQRKNKKKMSSSSRAADKSGEKQRQETWRVFGVEVHPDKFAAAVVAVDPKEDVVVGGEDPSFSSSSGSSSSPQLPPPLHPTVWEALCARLKLSTTDTDKNGVTPANVRLVRQSIDARSNQRRSDGGIGPRYVYVLDVMVDTAAAATTATVNLPWLRWKNQPGRMERIQPPPTAVETTQTQINQHQKKMDTIPTTVNNNSSSDNDNKDASKPRVVIIVGAGPAGLFCALQLLLQSNGKIIPIVLERGQPVEVRGKDIGALMHRKALDGESNFAFGEGGAGTWSDGKLTTRIGRNSDAVRRVLETLVQYGAPTNILVEGAPHLGTDNLVRLLRNLRRDLRTMGGEIRFGTKMTSLVIENGVTLGVDYVVSRETVERNMGPREGTVEQAGGATSDETVGRLLGDAVVVATGHSARDVYQQLHDAGVQLEAKGFAVGFRVEHPQKLINKIQYGTEWGPSVVTGKKTTDSANDAYFADSTTRGIQERRHDGKLPVPSYRLATDDIYDGDNHGYNQSRGVYSFCMCPGGQIVPASTDPEEVCVNGMSFSRRDSLWANSALVVTVCPDDAILEPYRQEHGVLAGLAFQRDMERRASILGGGNLTVPVQRLTDFVAGRPSTSAPSSSYRLGVKPAACHTIYPAPLVKALRYALTEHFDRQMPGFVCDEGLLHAVETRTSSPVRIARHRESLQATGGLKALYPAGEGAGFAGGIVSAAVDGMVVAEAVLENLLGHERGIRDRLQSKSKLETFY